MYLPISELRQARGPGEVCPNQSQFDNQVILGHRFSSEVILLALSLPDSLDAPFMESSGKALWYSFGTLISKAATQVLQIDPGEIQVGVRPIRDAANRLLGEVFLYDTVPGGAGYARSIQDQLEVILQTALKLGRLCPNRACAGACYHCMFDYRNQFFHPLLDRALGTAVLEFVIDGQAPSLKVSEVKQSIDAFEEYARADWTIQRESPQADNPLACILKSPSGDVGIWPIHPLSARPSAQVTHEILARTGVRCAVHTTFDLQRRPFWVVNHLLG